MNAFHALAPRPPTPVDPHERTDLTALLELFSAEEPVARTGSEAPSHPRPSVRDTAARLLASTRARTRASWRRAVAWGSGPQGAWRAW